MIARQFDPIAELQSAFTLLTKNFSLAAIPLVALLIVGALFGTVVAVAGGSALLAGGLNNPMALAPIITGALLWFGLALLVGIIVELIGHAAVIAASQSAWEGRAPMSGAGVSRALSRLGDLVVAGIVLGLIFLVICWTIIGPLVLGFLMMYVLPAIIVSGESAFQAMGTSWNLTTKNFGPTFAAFIGIVLAAVVAGIINAILGHIPILGWIIALVIGACVGAFSALVVVRFYDLLRGATTATLVTPTAPPPPPASSP